jgi:hypothetical protein
MSNPARYSVWIGSEGVILELHSYNHINMQRSKKKKKYMGSTVTSYLTWPKVLDLYINLL